jgi:hypothetical protein
MLLSQIDPLRAAVHARNLLDADAASDRGIAAQILAESGSKDDAELLGKLIEREPSKTVRSEFSRAMRRLTVGDKAAAYEVLAEWAGLAEKQGWLDLDPDTLYGDWVDAVVEGLNRVTRAEQARDHGTAIDQLNEVAKILLFRAIDVAGADIPLSDKIRVQAATNNLDYGSALGMQQLMQSWPWAHHFASLYQLRTEHLAPKGSHEPHTVAQVSEWNTAQSLFRSESERSLNVVMKALSL